jgi:hypothetical protein
MTATTAMASGRLRLCRPGHRVRPGSWRSPGSEDLRHPRIHERSALQELLTSLELNGVLIQADALHTTQVFLLVLLLRKRLRLRPGGRRDPDREVQRSRSEAGRV